MKDGHSSTVGTVALVLKVEKDEPALIEAISDAMEIEVLEEALVRGDQDPVSVVHAVREHLYHQDEEFGDYVEELLSQPFLKSEIRTHGIEWMKSKIKIEEYKRTEAEATLVIAQYALKVFLDDRSRLDFFLSGPKAKVRVRIFVLPEATSQVGSNSAA